MVRAHCVICMDEEVEFEDLRFVQCGHSFCVDCTDRIMTGIHPKCPTCRRSLNPDDGQRVHVSFSTEEQRMPDISTALRTLRSVDDDSTVQEVNQARRVYHHYCRNTMEDFDLALTAKEDMEMRILSCTADLEHQAREAPALRQTVDVLLAEVGGLRSQMHEMRNDLTKKNQHIAMLSRSPPWIPAFLEPWQLIFNRWLNAVMYICRLISFWAAIYCFFFVAGLVLGHPISHKIFWGIVKFVFHAVDGLLNVPV
ncbi:hypothetical protein HGRIS_013804 [Hohenbuehelia grisea]|uniref:RING-type domain-containing protein n=1 Tax=Hohenbuehelia grisea TaxID=104357 RepID=A0ABR3IWH5_9AGAR